MPARVAKSMAAGMTKPSHNRVLADQVYAARRTKMAGGA